MPVPKVSISAAHVVSTNRQLFGNEVPTREVCLGRISSVFAKTQNAPKFGTFRSGPVPLPDSKSWLTPSSANAIGQMYGNDQEGDCVIASLFHGVAISSANETGTAIIGTTAEALSEYHRLGGPGDNGLVISDVKDQLMTNGVSIGGKRRKIDGYAAVSPSDKMEVMVALLIAGGGVNIGFNVPSEWMGSATYDGAVWDTPRRYSFVGGHDVRLVGYNSVGVQLSTWGIVLTMTWAAFMDSRIVDECWIELQEDWISTGTAPSGFNVVSFKAALTDFKAGKVPDWAPPSPPPPPPPPTPATTITVTGKTSQKTVTIPARTIQVPSGFWGKLVDVTIPAQTFTIPSETITSTGDLPK